MWPTKTKWNAKSLSATYGNVGAKLAGWSQHCQRQQITINNGHAAGIMNQRNISGNIAYRPAAARIADQCAKTPLWQLFCERRHINVDTHRPGTGA